MSTITWGMLAKNFEDPEKIEEAIQRLIEAHKNDPTAHLEEGQSLKTHRSQEEADHPDGSVAERVISDAGVSLRKFTNKHRTIVSAFESLDGWDTFGNVFHRFGGVAIYTDPTTESRAFLSQVGLFPFVNFSKEVMCQFSLMVSNKENCVAYFGIANAPQIGTDISSITYKIENGNLYAEAVGKDESEQWQTITKQIENINVEQTNIYRILHEPALQKISFIINGEVAVVIDEISLSDVVDQIATFDIETLENAEKRLSIMDLIISVKIE